MTAVTATPPAIAEIPSEAIAPATPVDSSPIGLLGAFVKLLSDLTGKESGVPDPARPDEPDNSKENDPAPAVAPVSLPAPQLLSLLGTAFLPAAPDVAVSTELSHPALAGEAPAAEALGAHTASPRPAVQWPSCPEGIPENARNPESGLDSELASPAAAFSNTGRSPAASEDLTDNKAALIRALTTDPAARNAAIGLPAPAISPAVTRTPAAVSFDPEPAAAGTAPAPAPITPFSAVPVSEADPPEDRAPAATLAFAYRLTPLARHHAAAQPAAPAAATSGASSYDVEPAAPDTHRDASRVLPNHAPATLQPIEPEPAGAKELAPAAPRLPSGTTPAESIPPYTTRSAGVPGPMPRPATPAAAPPPEPAGPSAPAPAAHEIRLQVAGNSQRVDVRLTEHAGEVQVAVRTPDARLAGSLREDLPVLSARLEQAGFRAEAWQPGGWTSSPHGQTAETRAIPAAAHSEEPGRQNHSRQQQPDSQRHGHEREAPSGESRPEFSGFFESTG